jgi:3-hydroxy-9,10-secoandrosta-1,3,5(10)-triene-9,17-dione monooxygenase
VQVLQWPVPEQHRPVQTLKAENTVPAPHAITSANDALARAEALRPMLRLKAEENDRRGHHGEALEREFVAAGFYHLLVPRAYGGLECDYADFFRVMVALSRGHPSTGWGVTLAASHAPLIAAHWSEQAQQELLGPGHFAAPHRAAPSGHCERVPGGCVVDGVWPWCSGIAHATHLIAATALHRPGAQPELVNVVVPRSQCTVIDDWGGDSTLGMRASGSNSVRLHSVFVPEHLIAPMAAQYRLLDPAGTHGTRLHGNPMYLGLTAAPYHAALVAPTVGAAQAALDAYRELLLTKHTHFPPHERRADAPEFQRAYGEATAMADAAESLLLQAMAQHADAGRRWQAGGPAPDTEQQVRLWGQLQRAGTLACDAVDLLFRSAGSTAARQGSRLLSYMADAQMYRSHMTAQAGSLGVAIGRARLGLRAGMLDF